MSDKLKIGTRGSRLALVQTQQVVRTLEEESPDLEVEVVTKKTSGDRFAEQSIHSLSGKGFFTKDLDEAVLNGEVDAAVHSAKDVPTDSDPGLFTSAILERNSAADVFIARGEQESIGDLPEGALVGTSSLRRRAQILNQRPDLDVCPIRGNVDTRLEKLFEKGEVDALLLAEAGLIRLERQDVSFVRQDPTSFIPAPGQGAILVQCREEQSTVRTILDNLNDAETELEVTVERDIIEALEGGCRIPLGAYCERGIDGTHRIHGMVASLDGDPVLTARETFESRENVERAVDEVVKQLREQGAEQLINRARSYLKKREEKGNIDREGSS